MKELLFEILNTEPKNKNKVPASLISFGSYSITNLFSTGHHHNTIACYEVKTGSIVNKKYMTSISIKEFLQEKVNNKPSYTQVSDLFEKLKLVDNILCNSLNKTYHPAIMMKSFHMNPFKNEIFYSMCNIYIEFIISIKNIIINSNCWENNSFIFLSLQNVLKDILTICMENKSVEVMAEEVKNLLENYRKFINQRLS